MLLLVFMSIAFSFLAKEEGLKEVPRVQAQLNDALAKNKELTRENARLSSALQQSSKELDKLKQFLKRIGVDSTTLRPNGNTIHFDTGATFVLTTASGKAPGRPLCALKSVYLISFALLPGNAFRGTAAWDTNLDAEVAGLAGVATLASGRDLGLSEFEDAARQLQHDAVLKRSGCVFAVKAVRKTNDASVFDTELSSVERYFYVRHD